MPDVKIMASGLGFPEGPVWMADGSVILGEISGKKVTRVAPDGSKTEIGKAGGGPNGVATGPDGALYVCNNGGAVYETTPGFLSTGPALDYKGGSIQRIDPKTGVTKTLYSEVNGHKLSAPNDLVFDRQGGFYITDLGKRFPHHRDNGGLYYALPDGSSIKELVYPIITPNGVGLSPDEKTVYVADTETSRIYAWDIVSPGQVKHEPFPAPYGGRCVCGLPGFQRFDSLALEANGNICVATLVTGYITVISPSGQVVQQVKMPDVYPTNICFGGPGVAHRLHHPVGNRAARRHGLARVWAEAQFHVLNGDGRSNSCGRRRGADMIEASSEAVALRIYCGSDDTYEERPLAEAIVMKARAMQMAGATVTRGILGYGLSKHIHRIELILSQDLPLIVEVIDAAEKIDAFVSVVEPMIRSGLVTIENIKVLRYGAAKTG